MNVRIKCEEHYSLVEPAGDADRQTFINEYGIRVEDESGNGLVVNGVTDSRELARSIVDYLNENEVAAEHFMQVLEEILCGWVCLHS